MIPQNVRYEGSSEAKMIAQGNWKLEEPHHSLRGQAPGEKAICRHTWGCVVWYIS